MALHLRSKLFFEGCGDLGGEGDVPGSLAEPTWACFESFPPQIEIEGERLQGFPFRGVFAHLQELGGQILYITTPRTEIQERKNEKKKKKKEKEKDNEKEKETYVLDKTILLSFSFSCTNVSRTLRPSPNKSLVSLPMSSLASL